VYLHVRILPRHTNQSSFDHQYSVNEKWQVAQINYDPTVGNPDQIDIHFRDYSLCSLSKSSLNSPFFDFHFEFLQKALYICLTG
jgi:hypothetical protein